MNILFLSQIVPFPPHGGVLQRGYNLIRWLGMRHRIHLLAFVHPDVLPSHDELSRAREELAQYCERVEFFSLWPKQSKALGLLGYGWGVLSGRPFGVLAHRSSALRARIAALVSQESFDLAHFDTLALAPYAELLGGVPMAVTHHNIESQLMQRRATREDGALARWYVAREARKLRRYEEAECRRFDVNVTVSDADAQVLRAMLPDLRVAVVPNGVDVEYFDSEPNRDDTGPPVLIYTGGMNMFANRDAVLHFVRDIWPAIRREVPRARFYAVGQDPPAELRKLAEGDSGIFITGYVDDIRPLVASATVYVVPLRVGGGTRLKVLDAMAMRRAIVATSIGAEGIHAAPGREIVIADDPEEFTLRTVELLRSPTQRARLGEAARALVEREYAWGIVGRRLEEAYEVAVAVRSQGGQQQSNVEADSQCAA